MSTSQRFAIDTPSDCANSRNRAPNSNSASLVRRQSTSCSAPTILWHRSDRSKRRQCCLRRWIDCFHSGDEPRRKHHTIVYEMNALSENDENIFLSIIDPNRLISQAIQRQQQQKPDVDEASPASMTNAAVVGDWLRHVDESLLALKTEHSNESKTVDQQLNFVIEQRNILYIYLSLCRAPNEKKSTSNCCNCNCCFANNFRRPKKCDEFVCAFQPDRLVISLFFVYETVAETKKFVLELRRDMRALSLLCQNVVFRRVTTNDIEAQPSTNNNLTKSTVEPTTTTTTTANNNNNNSSKKPTGDESHEEHLQKWAQPTQTTLAPVQKNHQTKKPPSSVPPAAPPMIAANLSKHQQMLPHQQQQSQLNNISSQVVETNRKRVTLLSFMIRRRRNILMPISLCAEISCSNNGRCRQQYFQRGL